MKPAYFEFNLWGKVDPDQEAEAPVWGVDPTAQSSVFTSHTVTALLLLH